MKKAIVTILVLTFMLTLCACTQDPVQTEPQTTAADTTAPVETTDPAETTQADRKALAQTCVDKPVSELIALIGEPESEAYVPSCLGDGEDGNLYYDGFTVYTFRQGDAETVTFVE